jgi:hypothetical protein
MKAPIVPTELKYSDLNFTFRVLAYRQLSRDELLQAFGLWQGQSKRNRPKKNQLVEVTSIIGFDE